MNRDMPIRETVVKHMIMVYEGRLERTVKPERKVELEMLLKEYRKELKLIGERDGCDIKD